MKKGGGVLFRVWAPAAESVGVRILEKDGGVIYPLRAEGNGYHSEHVAEAKVGDLYRYVLPSGEFPDPASRFQPDGPHGPSQVVDPQAFVWSDVEWAGVTREKQIIYEMHIGTFTKEGTWAAAIPQLERLAEMGITLLEVMPVADFAGRHGWGYDGVNLNAPTRIYGSPDDFRRFVNRAHALGLGQIQVKSGLGEPLLAEIPVISSDPSELVDLDAGLASPETFTRIGLEPPVGIVADLRFTVGSDAQGRPVIRVTTAQPVTQPLLDFLVQVDWGQGRLVREYSATVGAPFRTRETVLNDTPAWLAISMIVTARFKNPPHAAILELTAP